MYSLLRNVSTYKRSSSGLFVGDLDRGHPVVFKVHLLTYLLTPWRRFLLEKLTGLHLVKKLPAFYGTRKFITAVTSARHLSLS